MVNTKLLEVLSTEKLRGLGFVFEDDGSGDPRGYDWNIRNGKFHLVVDPWCEVKLSRVNPDTDYVTIHCETEAQLEEIVDWIKD